MPNLSKIGVIKFSGPKIITTCYNRVKDFSDRFMMFRQFVGNIILGPHTKNELVISKTVIARSGTVFRKSVGQKNPDT